MTDINAQRLFVQGLYPGTRWPEKVRRMPDNQVTAIYLREINKQKEKAPKQDKESGDDGIPF